MQPLVGVMRNLAGRTGAFATLFAMTATLAPGGAGAQQNAAASAPAAETLETITVTGSYIHRTDAETPSPVTVIDAEQISKAGYKNIADAIRSISADNSGTLTQAFSGAMAGGASGVSLRGLTVDATLVLVDGHRMAPYGLADDGQRPFVDISSLPLAIVERIEVLRDGASAIYGSDAIAGVVNVILKKQFKGIEISANAGTSYKWDGGSERMSALYGFGDIGEDGHNVYFNVEARHQDAIAQDARGGWLGTMNLTPWGGPDLRGGLIQGNLPYGGTTYTIPGQVVPLNGVAANEAPYLLPGCAPQNLVSSVASGSPAFSLSGSTAYGCAWDTNQYKKIQPKTDGLNISGHYTQTLGAGYQSELSVNFFHSGSEQYRQSNGYNVPTNLVPFAWAGSLTGTVNQFDTSTTKVLLPANSPDNPFNPKSPYFAAAQAYYGSYFASYVGQPALFYGALTDVGSQHAIYDTNVFRLAEDVTGNIAGWDVTGSFGYVDSVTHVTYQDFLQPNAFYSALASGAYRVGQNSGLNPASLYTGLAPETEDTATSNLTYVAVNGTRNLFNLPGGPLALATGAEARRLSMANPGEPQAPQGNIQMDGSFYAFGSQDVLAAYVELSAPVVKNVEVDAALRADDYINIGDSVTPKIGAKWKAIESLAFRGTFARGFRAPGIAESGNAGSGSSTTPAPPDPLRCNSQPGAPNTTQDCGGPGSSVALLTRSNPSLQPEKSHSTTIGFIFEPVRDFNFTADYYKIRRDGEIAPAPYLPNNAIRSPAPPGSTFPGEVIGYLTPYVNESYSLVTGVDAEAKKIFDLKDWGKLTLSADVSHMITGEQTVDGVTYHYVGTVGPTSLSGSVGTPATRANYTVDWTRGPLALGAIYTWHSAMKGVDESVGPGCIQMSSTNPYCYVLGFGYATVYGQYQWNANLEFTTTITNVTNRMAPLNNVTYGGQNYNASLDQAGAVGRYMEVGFRYRM